MLTYFTVIFIFSKSGCIAQFTLNSKGLQIGGVDVDTYGQQQQQQQEQLRAQQVNFIFSKEIEKPIDEMQEFVFPYMQGQTAIIPLLPPPATPVQIVRPNTAANEAAVFLGSGALGVVALGGGAFVLGSGGLGYSTRRSNPRVSFRHPLLPPVRASADLIPAAVSAPQIQQLQGIQYSFPSVAQLPNDQNGYEYLHPDRVAFGDPLPPRPLKTTNSYATPTLDQNYAGGAQGLENLNSELLTRQFY